MDVIAGGGGPGRGLPRRLVVVIEVALGAAALVWVGLQVAHHVGESADAPPTALTVIGMSEPSYRPGHGELEIELQNDSRSTVYIDDLTVLNVGTAPSDAWAPSWIRTEVIDHPGWSPTAGGGSPALDVEVNGLGGIATLRVSIDPDCEDSLTPSPAEIVVGYRSASGALSQMTIPEVLNAGATALPIMVNAACGAPPDPSAVAPPIGHLRAGKRYSLNVADTALSFAVPGRGWRNEGNLYLGKRTSGGNAEAVLLWAGVEGVPDGVTACGQWWGAPSGDVLDYAGAVGDFPWAKPTKPISVFEVGGRHAAATVLRVQNAGTCQPGFLYTWPEGPGGGWWTGARRGDTLQLWIVDVDGPILVVEAISHPGAGIAVKHEIQQIVASMSFG